ncbi:MAG: hypothetical protein IJS88_06665 [Alphaproteobacteria bacterium]|nr:hypothetical protein [Alphaproteobacteria bacterium]
MEIQGILNEQNILVKPGMFNLTDGRNVSQLSENDRRYVRAVIFFVDEERHCAIGLCPVCTMLPFSFSCLSSVTEDILSGREATKILLKEAVKQGIELPAAEFCVAYDKNGVQAGEAFLASAYEMKKMSLRALRTAWKTIGFNNCVGSLWSSSISQDFSVWMQNVGAVMPSSWQIQYRTFGVMPAIEIPL